MNFIPGTVLVSESLQQSSPVFFCGKIVGFRKNDFNKALELFF
jgi:hypothetical protein